MRLFLSLFVFLLLYNSQIVTCRETDQSTNQNIDLIGNSELNARWIGQSDDMFPDSAITGPAPFFRKEFKTDYKVKSATVYVSGLGLYELYINGNKTGDQVLAPAQTNYDRRKLNKLLYYYDDQSTKRVFYNVFDVTGLLEKGNNTIGMILGNGWYNQRDRTVEGCMWYSTPKLLFQMEITYENGEKEVVISDGSWKTATGPLLHDGIFTGEVYDSRLEQEGWNRTGFDDSSWNNAVLVRKPDGKLVQQVAPFDKVTRSFHPVSVKKTGNNSYLYDAGEMISGWIQFKIIKERGSEITIRHIEEMGTDYGQIDKYVCNGRGNEIYEPRFTWHSFRTFEISGITGPITLNDINIKVVNTDVKQSGEFECSNTLFNKIFDNYKRTQLGNFHGSISSDCPHRERLGYTGDGQVVIESAIFCFDMTGFYKKWFDDIDDARNKKTGYVPHTAPFGGGGGGPAWGSAYVIMPWYYYKYYNDKKVLEQHYEGMKQWVHYLGTRTDSAGIVVREEPNGWCLGDWATPKKIELPEPLVNTCYYYYVTRIMSDVATVLGKNEDAFFFKNQAAKIKKDFNQKFYNNIRGCYYNGKQGANVFPLAFGMVDDNEKTRIIETLIGELKNNNFHFDTGILGTPLLLEVLTSNNLPDVAYTLMNQPDFPGYGYYINGKGATTLWENWNGESSHSHPMYGSVVSWFFKSLAGINLSPNSAGNNYITIKPIICGDLKYVNASYNSVYGTIRSGWNKSDKETSFDIEIPANTTATIYLPFEQGRTIKEDGIDIKSNYRILSISHEHELVKIVTTPGSFHFTIQ